MWCTDENLAQHCKRPEITTYNHLRSDLTRPGWVRHVEQAFSPGLPPACPHMRQCVCGPIVGTGPPVKLYSSPVWSLTTALGWSTTAAKVSMMTEQITHFLLESCLYFLRYSALRCSVSKEQRLWEEVCGFSAAFCILHTCEVEVEHTRSRSWWVKIRATRVNTHVPPSSWRGFRGYLRDIKSNGALPGKTRNGMQSRKAFTQISIYR